VALMSHSNSTSNTINTANTTTATATAAAAPVAVLPSDDVDRVLVELQRRKNSHEGTLHIYLFLHYLCSLQTKLSIWGMLRQMSTVASTFCIALLAVINVFFCCISVSLSLFTWMHRRSLSGADGVPSKKSERKQE